MRRVERIDRQGRLAVALMGVLVLSIVLGWPVVTYLVNRYRAIVVAPWRDPREAPDPRRADPLSILGEQGAGRQPSGRRPRR